jgi:hypothetical protein
VEFAADKSYSESKDYKAFLESLGYRTFYKNVDVGLYLGKIKWRPWAKGLGQITTAPGSLQKELIIVEKKKDGGPFDLHTDLSDALPLYRTIRGAYRWTAGNLFAAAALCLIFAVTTSVYTIIGTVVCGTLGFLWLRPALKFSAKIRGLEETAKTNEYAPEEGRFSRILTVAVAYVLFGALLFWLIGPWSTASSGASSSLMRVENSGRDHWNASYERFNGFRWRNVSLGEGTHRFTVETATESGEISLSVKGKDGTEYYSGPGFPTSTFAVEVDGRERVTVRIDVKDHCGSYKISWE